MSFQLLEAFFYFRTDEELFNSIDFRVGGPA
jgi:hypothetical protein